MNPLLSDLEHTLATLRAGRLRVRIPPRTGLFRRIPRAFFHATPEIFIQTGGATDFECPGEIFRLRAGEVCVMPAGVPHIETPIDLKTPYGILVLMQVRDGLVIHRAAASPRREITAIAAEHLTSPRGRDAFRYLEDLSAPVPAPHRRAYLSHLLGVFFITVVAEWQRPATTRETRSPLVAEAEKLARALLADPDLSVARLAAALGCSADHLSRCFHREMGQNLAGWITGERVSMARDLLREPRHSVAEVGWMCGFSTPSYFIRVFRRHVGLPPRAWRETAQTSPRENPL